MKVPFLFKDFYYTDHSFLVFLCLLFGVLALGMLFFQSRAKEGPPWYKRKLTMRACALIFGSLIALSSLFLSTNRLSGIKTWIEVIFFLVGLFCFVYSFTLSENRPQKNPRDI
jgi:amino acid transporter